jgi:hypothetical protein
VIAAEFVPQVGETADLDGDAADARLAAVLDRARLLERAGKGGQQ